MKRVHRKMIQFLSAFITLCAIALWLFRPDVDALFSIRGAVLLGILLLFTYLCASVKGGTQVRRPFRLLAGFLALAFFAGSALNFYLFFSSDRATYSVLVMGITCALIGAGSAYSALSGRSPYWLFRKRKQGAV